MKKRPKYSKQEKDGGKSNKCNKIFLGDFLGCKHTRNILESVNDKELQLADNFEMKIGPAVVLLDGTSHTKN